MSESKFDDSTLEPVAWMHPYGGILKSPTTELERETYNIPLYLHPATRPEFVRLSEEEVSEILSSAHTPYEAVCATENRLVEKNK